MNPIHRFWSGTQVVFFALRILSQSPLLLAWSILPTTLTLALYFWLFSPLNALLSGALTGLTQGLFSDLPIQWVSSLILILISAFAFSGVAGILSVPFNDFLAEAAEKKVTPPLLNVHSPSWSERAQIVWADLKLSFLGLALTLLALLIGLIPGVNLIAPLPAVLGISLQYLSYPQTRRRFRTRDSIQFLLQHPWEVLGFGLVGRLLLSIPVISCFFIPVLVVAGTALFARLKHPPSDLTPS